MPSPEPENLADLIAAMDGGWQPKFVFYWGHKPRVAGVGRHVFSQWFEAPFEIDGICYPTAEHYMMAEKARLFGDETNRQKIIANPKPGAAKAYGRLVEGFDPATWEAHRTEIVVRANVAKFSQYPALGDYLLTTGDKVLVEASPNDDIWGIGIAADDEAAADPRCWPGLNLLGFALMRVRTMLREAGGT